MSAAAPLTAAPRRPLALATALAVAAGVGVGVVVAPDGRDAPPPPPPAEPRIGLASGVAKLPLPVDWRPLGRRSSLPGFGQATAVRAGGAEAALDIRAPENPLLLPASVVDAAGPPPALPVVRGDDGRTAWRYVLPGGAPGTQVVAFALPTTGGVVTIACAAAPRRLRAASDTCERAVATIRLKGAQALPPASETAAAIAAPAVVARLNRVRRAERRHLAATTSPRARRRAAGRVAAAYAAAARDLRPLAGGGARRLPTALDDLARAHRRLGEASRRRRPAAARRAGARIQAGERRLEARLAALRRLGGAR